MYSILIIDDEQVVSNVLEKILSRFGYYTEIATGGQAGIRKFDSGLFDLVITDVQMAGIDGNDVARHVRNSHRPFTPIMGISGTPWLLESDEFDCVLSKPFGVQALLDAVKHIIACTAPSQKDSYNKAVSA